MPYNENLQKNDIGLNSGKAGQMLNKRTNRLSSGESMLGPGGISVPAY